MKKGDLSTIISNFESKVSNLQIQLDSDKKALATLASKEQSASDYKQKVSDLTTKVIDTRTELNNARAELHRNNYLQYIGDPKSLDPKLYESLTPLSKELFKTTKAVTDQPHINVVATVSKTTEEKRLNLTPRSTSYNVIFEACAGINGIKLPEAIILSDSESLSVKIGTEILPNSCQTTSTNIRASDKESIGGVLVTTGGHSNLLKQLETKVDTLKS